MGDFVCKRIYEAATPEDGFRVLVDGLWPRGLSRSDLQIDLWAKTLAPSATLRKSFAHQPARWADFLAGYHRELEQKQAAISDLLQQAGAARITLLYAARDTQHNNARALADYLQQHRHKLRK